MTTPDMFAGVRLGACAVKELTLRGKGEIEWGLDHGER